MKMETLQFQKVVADDPVSNGLCNIARAVGKTCSVSWSGVFSSRHWVRFAKSLFVAAQADVVNHASPYAASTFPTPSAGSSKARLSLEAGLGLLLGLPVANPGRSLNKR